MMVLVNISFFILDDLNDTDLFCWPLLMYDQEF